MSGGPLFLALDLGTSACKGALVDATGATEASARAECPLLRGSGAVEQEPEALWTAAAAVMEALASDRSRAGRVAAIGLSAQMSTHALVDAADRPLTRFVSWADRRAEEESRLLAGAFPPDRLAAAYGAVLSPGPSWPVPRLRWWREREPERLDRARRLVQPKDWIVWKLSGAWASDLSSLRGLRHQRTGAVDAGLADWAGFSPELALPALPPDAVAGTLRAEWAERWGLPPATPVVVGLNDLAAAVLGAAGLPGEAAGLDITGTSEHLAFLSPGTGGISADAALFSEIPLFGSHRLRYGVTSSSGATLRWYWEGLRGGAGDDAGYAALEAEAASVPAGADGLLCLPCLDGERAPGFDPRARGAFAGMAPGHRPAHFSRSVLEGIAFTLRSIRDRLGPAPAAFRVLGGGSRIALWNQIKADVLRAPVTGLENPEAGCLGAAILCARAAGRYGSLPEAARAMIRPGRAYLPRPEAADVYDAAHARFEALRRALAPLAEGTPS